MDVCCFFLSQKQHFTWLNIDVVLLWKPPPPTPSKTHFHLFPFMYPNTQRLHLKLYYIFLYKNCGDFKYLFDFKEKHTENLERMIQLRTTLEHKIMSNLISREEKDLFIYVIEGQYWIYSFIKSVKISETL